MMLKNTVLRATLARILPAATAAVLLGSVMGYSVHETMSGGCCHAGSPCCYPGSPCCSHGRGGAPLAMK